MAALIGRPGERVSVGIRIADHLLDQPDVALRLLPRATAPAGTAKGGAVDALVARGAEIVTGDVTDPASLDAATVGVDVVVSALQGGPDIIVDGQIAVAEAAVRGGARRFLPSDFAIDLFSAPEGAPQFDMRRRADQAIDALPLQVVHVLNGGFMDMMLDPNTPGMVDVDAGTAMLWGTTPHASPRTSPPTRPTCRACATSPGRRPRSTRSWARPSASPVPP